MTTWIVIIYLSSGVQVSGGFTETDCQRIADEYKRAYCMPITVK